MKRIVLLTGLMLFGAVTVQFSEEPDDLAEVLKKCGEYCARLQNVTLDFVCLEKIEELLYQTGRSIWGPTFSTTSWRLRAVPVVSRKNNLLYDYQLIRKKGIIKEFRTLLEENGVDRNEKNAELKTLSYWHRHIVLGPIGLFCPEAQSQYDYRMVKGGKFKGEKAYIIEASPKPSAHTECLYGKAWISRKDHSVLKIEWKQESLRDFGSVEHSVRNVRMKLDVQLVTEYAFEKNGIRFPSLHSVRENYIDKRTGRRYRNAEVKVTYKDYRFFVVETEVIYK
jgi:hypothetical protein